MYSPATHGVVTIEYEMRTFGSPHLPESPPGRDTHICTVDRVGKLTCHNMTSPVLDWNPAADTDGGEVAHPKHEPSPLLVDTTVFAPPLVVSVMEEKADVRDTAMVSGFD